MFFELTFHGSPQKRDEMLKELRQKADQIKRWEAEGIPEDED